jgi:hypothetical protein
MNQATKKDYFPSQMVDNNLDMLAAELPSFLDLMANGRAPRRQRINVLHRSLPEQGQRYACPLQCYSYVLKADRIVKWCRNNEACTEYLDFTVIGQPFQKQLDKAHSQKPHLFQEMQDLEQPHHKKKGL